MKQRYSLMAVLAIGCSLVAGCGSKPDHNANWYYYWEKGGVVPGMDRAGSPMSRWAWNTTRAYGAAHGPSDGYCVTDLCIRRPRARPISVTHRTLGLTFNIGATTTYGVEQVAATAGHEKEHIANYRQRTSPGQSDTDRDGLADSQEGRAPYFFILGHRDTYNLGSRPNWGGYRRYGDNEFTARQAEQAAVNAAKLKEDWSRNGAQWRRAIP